ncbi:Cache 3/Cache 2 fusion domain-containing protein [Modicisalibacter luteus]|uniref:Cache 3/Cache 2 fusion domain-containing protein n=1 Tax=Modicisalibacter luteus TaxID=453962 RepID=UPI00363FF5A2
MSLLKSLRRANIGVKLSILVAVVQLIGFLGLGIVLSQSASHQLRSQVSQSLDKQQSQVADMVELFDQTLQEEAGLLLTLFLNGLAPGFSLNPNQKVLVAGRQTPALSNGGNVLNGNYSILDHFTAQTGAPITLFARDGNDFVRVTTSLKKSDGERAVGTLLDPASKSYAQLMNGKPYLGLAELFGTPFITKYQPILDRNGKVIGASFIGIDITEQMAMLKGKVRHMSQGESGYTMLVSANPAQQGQVIAGGPHEGGSLMNLETLDGEPAFSALFGSASGEISYALAGNDTRQRTTHYLAYPQWDWVIASTVFDDEVNSHIVALRNWAILAATLLALGFSVLLYLCQRSLISRPLASLVALAQGLSKGISRSECIPRVRMKSAS